MTLSVRPTKPYRKYTSPPNTATVKIYIDESGDLGFSERSSPFFVIAALIVHDPLAIRRCFAKVRRNKLKKKYKELASNSSSTIPARRSRNASLAALHQPMWT
ncbi:MAG: DUF3800 domain-containing protein [Methanomicrobiales archaeon]